MTSKEIIKELRKEIDKILQTGKSLRSYRIYQYLDMLEKDNPTLSECIKEWEEEGYLCEKTSRHFYIEEVNGNVIATFHILEKYLYTSMFINRKRLNLLTKTLKALEAENENSRKN